MKRSKRTPSPYSFPPSDYEDLVPELKQLTDFIDQSSDEEDEREESTVTRVGLQYQVAPPRYGTVTHSTNRERMVWDSKRLSPEIVEQYLAEAEKHWPASYLSQVIPFNEPDALKILHVKDYRTQKALEAIVCQRLPYVLRKF